MPPPSAPRAATLATPGSVFSRIRDEPSQRGAQDEHATRAADEHDDAQDRIGLETVPGHHRVAEEGAE